MKNYEYLYNFHLFWNGELKYVFENRNNKPLIHLDFLTHIVKYWTIDEIIWFYQDDIDTFNFLKNNIKYIFYKKNKERLFRNNKFLFNEINIILNNLGFKNSDIIYFDKEIEEEEKYNKKIQKITDMVILEIKKYNKKKNEEKIKKIFSKRDNLKCVLRC